MFSRVLNCNIQFSHKTCTNYIEQSVAITIHSSITSEMWISLWGSNTMLKESQTIPVSNLPNLWNCLSIFFIAEFFKLFKTFWGLLQLMSYTTFIFNFFFLIKAPHFFVLGAKPDLIQELFGLTSRPLNFYENWSINS